MATNTFAAAQLAQHRYNNMSTSPYIKFQDKNFDGLPDICEPETTKVPVCLTCVPNPKAINPDWKKRNKFQPFINQKICKFQVTMVTNFSDTGWFVGATPEQEAENLNSRFETFAEEAIISILDGFQKEDTGDIIRELRSSLQYTAFHLEPRVGSKLKLLYSIPAEVVNAVPDRDDTVDPGPNVVGAVVDKKDIVVKYNSNDLAVKAIRVRKGLNLHERFYKVYRAVEGGVLKYADSGRIFNFDEYGDGGMFWNNGLLEECVGDLERFLNNKGYNIPNVGAWRPFSNDTYVQEIQLTFNYQYDLKKLEVFIRDCPNKPIVYSGKKLRALKGRDGWKDRTAVAYFAQIKEMDQALSARVPMDWQQFVEKFTYPEVRATVRAIPGSDGGGPDTVLGCIGEALENDMKELGQDILDETFSLADAIAYRFRQTLCASSPAELNDIRTKQGTNQAWVDGLYEEMNTNSKTNIYAMAKMQALKDVDPQDAVFANLCMSFLMGGINPGCGMSPVQQLDALWANGFDRLRICGLLDLFLAAIQCLFAGLTLEEALASVVRSALEAMGVENIGSLFVGLPPEKQAELDKIVKQKLKSGDIFPDDSAGQALSDRIAGKESVKQNNFGDKPIMGKIKFERPWEDEEYVKDAKVPDHNRSGAAGSDDTTLAQRLSGTGSNGAKHKNIIMQAYIEALMELYQDAYLELIDLLNDFPGAQIISFLIATLDCPSPPLFNPGIDDFLKSLSLPFCRNINPLVVPRFENPFMYIPKLSDILWLIFKLLHYLVMCLVLKIIILILSKICEIIGDAICKALELAGNLVASLPAIISGREGPFDFIKETICGPDTPDEQVEQTIVQIVADLGVGAAAFADPGTAQNFWADCLNSMTKEEAMSAILEGPNDTALEVIDNMIQLNDEYAAYREAFPHKRAISKFFLNVGNLVPAQVRSDIQTAREMVPEENMLPMNPSICASPEQINLFEEHRCAILEGRMSPDQCQAQNERLKDEILEDLGDISRVMQEGIGETVAKNMPPVFSDPGCDNGMLPLEPEELQNVSTYVLKTGMDQLGTAFTLDMLDDGPTNKDKKYGFLNMLLADTLGNPFTEHMSKAFSKDNYTTFNMVAPGSADITPDQVRSGEVNVPTSAKQKGAVPLYVGEWLRHQFDASGEKVSGLHGLDLAPSDLLSGPGGSAAFYFRIDNEVSRVKPLRMSFDKLGWSTGKSLTSDVELTQLDQLGYNYSLEPDFVRNELKISYGPRKNNPDTILSFKDNCKGYRSGLGSDVATDYSYGFDILAFYADIGKNNSSRNIPNDNMRIQILEKINLHAYNGSDGILDTIPGGEESITESTEGSSDSRKVISNIRFEFFAVDDGLDGVDISDYPSLSRAMGSYKANQSPIPAALQDLTKGELRAPQANTLFNKIQEDLYKTIFDEISSNESAWLYGMTPDDLTKSDIDYLAPEGTIVKGRDVYGEDYFDSIEVETYNNDGEFDGYRSVAASDRILGISRYQYEVETGQREGPNRVIYLDPNSYGGNTIFPPLHIMPKMNTGFMGAVQVMFPAISPCKPQNQDLIGFDDINDMIDNAYPRIPEDKRLKSDPDCIEELPFDRILSRPGRAGLQGVIMGSIRIFAATHLIKGMPVFATFGPDFPTNYSKIYAAYLVERMEESFRDPDGNDSIFQNFKDNEFWYAFLEQSVQLYSRRMDDPLDDSIQPEDVPQHVKDAFGKIKQMQKSYNYPFQEELRAAKARGDATMFESLKAYRESKNLEAVQSVEKHAKTILIELVNEQLKAVGQLFQTNLERVGFSPIHVNMEEFFLKNLCTGTENLNFSPTGKYREDAVGLPDPGKGDGLTDHYTTGKEFILMDGTPYSGEYHIHEEEDGNFKYMTGPRHSSGRHETLVPLSRNVVVGYDDPKTQEFVSLGDVYSLNSVFDTSNNFYIKKFVSINGVKMDPVAAATEIRNAGNGLISDYYPGDLELVYIDVPPDEMDVRGTETKEPVGIKGNLGVQYGIEFGVMHPFESGSKIEITSVTVDALDTMTTEFNALEANSPMLLCLIKLLRNTPEFKLAVSYIVNAKKALATTAIYTDMGILYSIGEVTREKGAKHDPDATNKPGAWLEMGAPTKTSTGGLEFPEATSGGTVGWAYEGERSEGTSGGWFGLFTMAISFDQWDKKLLRRSSSRIKSVFKPLYRNRKFGDDDPAGSGDPPWKEFASSLKARFSLNPGMAVVPSFRKPSLKGNPFDAKGNMCKK